MVCIRYANVNTPYANVNTPYAGVATPYAGVQTSYQGHTPYMRVCNSIFSLRQPRLQLRVHLRVTEQVQMVHPVAYPLPVGGKS